MRSCIACARTLTTTTRSGQKVERMHEHVCLRCQSNQKFYAHNSKDSRAEAYTKHERSVSSRAARHVAPFMRFSLSLHCCVTRGEIPLPPPPQKKHAATQQNTTEQLPACTQKKRGGWVWGGGASSFHLQVIQLSRLSTGCDPRPVDSHGRDGARCVEGASLFQSQCRAIPIYMLSGCVECTGAPTPLLQKLECPCRQDGGGVVSFLPMCSEAVCLGRVLKKRT